jgi:small-conductance mechanosensitive channel
VVLYLFSFRRIYDKALQVIFFLLTINFLVDLYGLYKFWHHKNNIVVYNLYLAVETLLVLLFFSKTFKSSRAKKVLIPGGVVLFCAWVYLFFTIQNTDYLNLFQTFENLAIFILAIYYFYEHVFKLNTNTAYSHPIFWAVTAYLIYSAGTFFLLLFMSSLSRHEQEEYYVLNYIFVIIRTILLLTGIFMKTDNPITKKLELT